MKKVISLLLTLVMGLSLVACSYKATVNPEDKLPKPNKVTYQGETYIINQPAPSDTYSTENSLIKAGAGSANGNDFIYVPGENGEVRCIRIKTAEAEIYGNIKIGDDASKVQEEYENVMVRDGVGVLYVFFDGTENIDYMSDEYADHDMNADPFDVIAYAVSGGKVTAIMVADELFIMNSK